MTLTSKERVWLGLAIAAGPAWWLAGLAPGDAGVVRSLPHDASPFLLTVLVYPMLEEATFRGWLQGMLRGRAWGLLAIGPLSMANVAADAAFALAHLPWHAPSHALAVMVPGLVFGWLRDSTGGIAAPVALHVFYNAGLVLVA